METGLYYPLKLNVLPKDWRVGYVGDFVDEIQPGFASGKHNKEGTGIPHIRPFNINRQGKLDLSEIKSVAPDSDVKRLRTDDVLFNNTNSPELIGKTTAITSAGDWGFSNHMTRIRFKDDVSPKFASYQLHFLWMVGYFLHNCVKHVNQASISSKTLANAVPFIAPPIDQQELVVAEIEKQFSRLDEAVTNLKRIKANLKRYKAAVLKAAVEGRLVETEAEIARHESRSYETGEQLLQRILETRRRQWKAKGKYKEAHALNNEELCDLPEGWAWASLEQINFANRPCAYGVLQPGEDVSNGVLLVRVGDINDGRVDLTALKQISSKIADRYPRTKLEGGEFLITLVGAIGRTAVTPYSLAGSNVARAVGVVPLSNEINPHWVEIWFRNPAKIAEMTSKSHEVARKTLNLEDVRVASVAIPPQNEQERIVVEVDRRLSLVREIEKQIDSDIVRAERLRQAVLANAFNPRGLGALEESVQ